MDFHDFIETVGSFVDLAGVAAIVAGAVVASVVAVRVAATAVQQAGAPPGRLGSRGQR